MMKSICVLARREDSTREVFQTYYETQHAPLGMKYFPFAGYSRNHLLDAPDIGFDTISEFWTEDTAASAGLMDGPIGEIMRADERRFMDQSKIAPAGAEEHVLSAGAEDGERYAVLLSGKIGKDTLLAWARKAAGNTPGVSLDIATSWKEPAFPATAVLWTPDATIASELPAGVTARVLRVRRVTTCMIER
ncbi:MAG TPA: EthD domain-containing protein [Spongiibacteraceae bacterium]|nr:EthD domain-containing protein [Spongiibacteraceae bacterium]